MTVDAAVAETHLSVVVFVGDRAYKLKKPIKTPFVDFSTRAGRRAACEREVELNRRLAPGTYLGVADVTGPDGAVCDHLVVMRRMPDDRRLSSLVKGGADTAEELRRVAHRVAAFHRVADCSADTSASGTADAVRRNWLDNAEEMRPFAGAVLDRALHEDVVARACRYLDGRAPLFDARIAAGRVRDGHGDLLADDIFCLDDGPQILDCIEFEDRLRYGDVLADAAFLAMDLERLGRPDLSRQFLAAYAEASGDAWPASLAHHYIAYRAQVRAKVACLRHDQGEPEAARAAAALLALAARHLRQGQVRLVLVGGLPGSGKTTLAAALGDITGWPVLRSDVIRKELAGVPAAEPAAAAYQSGIYGTEHTGRTHQELLVRAEAALRHGHSVLLDATWRRARHRELARATAERARADVVELCCDAPRAVRERRARVRSAAGRDASDADPVIADAVAADADPWPSATTLDTAGPIAVALEAAASALELQRPGDHPWGGSAPMSG